MENNVIALDSKKTANLKRNQANQLKRFTRNVNRTLERNSKKSENGYLDVNTFSIICDEVQQGQKLHRSDNIHESRILGSILRSRKILCMAYGIQKALDMFPEDVSSMGWPRSKSNEIFDFFERRTGYQSQESIEERHILSLNKKTMKKKTKEHFYPREWSGRIIVNLVLFRISQGTFITENEIRLLLEVFRQVHETSSRENNILAEFQKVGTFNGDWVTLYNKLGIQLVHVQELGPILFIEDVLAEMGLSLELLDVPLESFLINTYVDNCILSVV